MDIAMQSLSLQVEGPPDIINSSKDEWWTEPPPNVVTGKKYFKEAWDRRKEEILFPFVLEPHWPWKQYNWFEELDPVMPRNFTQPETITIDNYSFLIHVTHNKEFQMITRSRPNVYTLRAQRKVGKNGYKKYDGTPVGHSFVAIKDEIPNDQSKYRYISSGENLLPGKYIWWSVYIENPPQAPYSCRPSTPFTSPHDSPYGKNMIYGQFEDVLATYQASFPLDHNGQYPTIELRVGGTLRYKFEVCYVIILCKSGVKELEQYPMWEEGRNKIKFDKTNNIVRIIDPINIRLNSSIKSSYGTNCSWDHFVFALYFDGDEEMICHEEIFDHQLINHSKCLKKKPPGAYKKFVCPDKLS
ncbi:PREDICTED: uncharacterized protein LOC109581147 [Amphimedon queenslandica]|uniref:Uncharacterized protein n=1 Tax=Amphimedon queenslandica TaxID=400682 RepID=A0A1X7V5D3_AMPQE|nr:PREDICTED: uncharacterized protein LOC109581147 [Amphimedon queenslandica]|eukprot:XP_019850535.1 PREDICTED: uncharacterized protein LOC109581147 [Amphimedon queenslandica]